jgi:hypothetical protein
MGYDEADRGAWPISREIASCASSGSVGHASDVRYRQPWVGTGPRPVRAEQVPERQPARRHARSRRGRQRPTARWFYRPSRFSGAGSARRDPDLDDLFFAGVPGSSEVLRSPSRRATVTACASAGSVRGNSARADRRTARRTATRKRREQAYQTAISASSIGSRRTDTTVRDSCITLTLPGTRSALTTGRGQLIRRARMSRRDCERSILLAQSQIVRNKTKKVRIGNTPVNSAARC